MRMAMRPVTTVTCLAIVYLFLTCTPIKSFSLPSIRKIASVPPFGLSSSSKLRSTSSSSSDDKPNRTIPPHPPLTQTTSFSTYQNQHQESITSPKQYWNEQALQRLDWIKNPTESNTVHGSLKDGNVRFFSDGYLNLCYNAIDRHVNNGRGEDVAMIWEGDEPTDTLHITFQELLDEVSQISNALLSLGVEKGDVITLYMPMIPQLPMTMLACSRIGAVHSVVFGGFSSDALAQRISASKSRFVVTGDCGMRGGRKIALKDIVNDALTKLDCEEIVQNVLVYERFYHPEADEAPYEMKPKDIPMNPLVSSQRPYCPPATMNSEDDLFILYTSGSTGSPKGLVHTTGGYALYAAMTAATTFNLQPDDIFACVADCGWITGHTYVVYGPLLNGCTTFLFESTPMYPDAGRYWDMVDRHGINVFYTAPTAIRSLMRFGDAIPAKYKLDTLKILGSVGEPINPEAWRWYYEVIGREKCTIVDTYWQTETGGHVMTNIPGVTPMKPGSCSFPFYGIEAVVLDPVSGTIIEENDVEGVLAFAKPWPGMARTCLNDHNRYLSTYLKPYPGFYYTDDAVYRDADGYYYVTGRCDDVLNVSGHRIGTAEVESALVGHDSVSQAAVVGKPHDIKGQSICAFVTLTVGFEGSDDLIRELRNEVRSVIGPFASPDKIIITDGLPMTRSGKIMRRILRKIVKGEVDALGDTSTLADPAVVDTLIDKVLH